MDKVLFPRRPLILVLDGPESQKKLIVSFHSFKGEESVATETDNVAATGALERGRGGDDGDGDGVETERLEEVLRVGVDVDGRTLSVESGNLGDCTRPEDEYETRRIERAERSVP